MLGRLATYVQDTFLHFELGRSTDIGAVPVSQTIREGIPVDIELLIGGLVLGTLGGLACTRRRRGPLARALRGTAILSLCLPVYSAALLALFLVSSNVGKLPLPFVSGSSQYVPLHARRHLLPVAAAPAASLVGASIGVLVLNIALVEVAFNLDGSFRNIRTAVTRLDLPLVQGMVLVATILVVIGSTLADLVLLLLEQRERR